MVKRLLLGRPPATQEEHEQRLPKRLGLAVFASDAISSTAYASEEILFILVPIAGLAALHFLVPISVVVMVVLAIVVTSYRQTIFAYPSGGAYVVGKDNLGTSWSLVAGASLLVDYSLTVAVDLGRGRGGRVGVPGTAGRPGGDRRRGRRVHGGRQPAWR